MPLFYAIPVFLGSLILIVGGGVFLSRGLSRCGRRFDIPSQFLGFLTALGADSPEISASVVSMISGHRDTAIGVVFGSNLFNLAALLGITAIIAGRVTLPREAVLLGGGVGILITAVAVALVLGAVSSGIALTLVLTLLVPYVLLSSLRRDSLNRLPLPVSWKDFLKSAASELKADSRQIGQSGSDDEMSRAPRPFSDSRAGRSESTGSPPTAAALFLTVFGSLVALVLGSSGLVQSTTSLTAGWLPKSLLGTLVLAVLTGIPNFHTAVRLAQRQLGSAVITETMNSNSLNIVAGLAIPSVVFGITTAHTAGGYLDIWWLLLMTFAVVCTLAVFRGVDRNKGIAVLVAYLTFVAIRIYLA